MVMHNTMATASRTSHSSYTHPLIGQPHAAGNILGALRALGGRRHTEFELGMVPGREQMFPAVDGKALCPDLNGVCCHGGYRVVSEGV